MSKGNHMSTDHHDVIIIGTGAGGGTLAATLAPTGKRILILERGGFLPRERENWDTRAIFEQGRYLASETWYDEHDQAFRPYTHYWVGGNTKVYGAALLRLRERDFGELRHWGGVSPAWPIGYDDLEPFYERAEWMYHVHGQRGSDPHEPRCARPFPHGPIPFESRMREMYEDLRAVGYNPFPIPLGVRLPEDARADPAGSRPAIQDAEYRLSNFDGYPDLTEAKADAHVCGVRPALAHPNVEIVTGARVTRSTTDRIGREVAGVEYMHQGEHRVARASMVVVACGAINSAALLLRSSNERWPRGLANSSDQVGRNYMCHQNGCFVAVMDTPNPSSFQKGFGLTEFYFGAPDSPHPLGTIQLMGKPDPGTLAWLRGDALPGMSMEDIAGRTVDFFLTAEDLPDPSNRVALRADGSIRLAYRRNNTEAYDRLRTTLEVALERAEARHGRARPTCLHQRLGISGVSHQNGTLRMGADPRASVVDIDGKAHDMTNLYVCDAGVFPSSGAVNPSLTIMAWALRMGEHPTRVLA